MILVLVSVISRFSGNKFFNALPNPHSGGLGAVLCQASTLWPIQHGQTCQGQKSQPAQLDVSLRQTNFTTTARCQHKVIINMSLVIFLKMGKHINDFHLSFLPCSKVHNLVAVHLKSTKLSLTTNLNMIFHVVM